ncbi:hypothetical protein Q0590_37055 [Rhodocytophaga aerolata]|uniref:Uncharacterized protein n=1 Tax=Rhodocytophaga aerolata TaxID=455078 RepID=A0ABT8RIJ8_9BACT|nr:hypothetical protein [Rhodocytophaga aerolata]MDO1451937.1 hypothetical protein [Rhodocytophaga aerolata]
MLLWILPHLRNVQTNGFWVKGKDKSCYFEAQLIHNLPQSMFESEFIEHDLHFLNHQARWYLEKCNDDISPLYSRNEALIRELISIAPKEIKQNLQWSFD